MCGIVGILSKEKDEKEVIKKMSKRIEHRGPDGEDFYIDEFIALAHRRLAIIDIETGSQPMTNEDDRLVLVFNGEIYNYKELRELLIEDGHTFKTSSDSEVLLHGYEKWGAHLPEHLRGMFAFAIWDKKDRSLFLARDHFGIKPLYYFWNDGHFVFASELKCFLDYDRLKRTFNRDLLEQYLAFGFTPGNATLVKDIFKLEPGHSLLIKDDELVKEKYFTLEFESTKEPFDVTVDKISKVLKDSSQKHLLSDVPVGSFLSSGIDSSYIVSLTKPKNTYTVGYEDYKENEIEYAKDLSDRLSLDNKNVLLTKEDYLGSLDDVLYYEDEPSGDPSIVALYHVARLASKDVKVVLSGEGADEFFGGYNNYLDEMKIPLYNKLPFTIRHLISKILSRVPEFKGRNYLVRRGMRLEDYYTGVNRSLSDSTIAKCLKKANLEHVSDLPKEIIKNYSDNEEIVKKQAVDISCWLANDILHKADRMGMANSIETRVPMTDIEVFKVARTLTKDKKISSSSTKIALREASRKVIPTDAYKKKKLGFPVPLREWLKEDDFYKEVLKTFTESKGLKYFDEDYLVRLIKDHKEEKRDNYKKIWTIYSFLKWYEIYF